MDVFTLSQSEGEYLVKLARVIIEAELSLGEKPDTGDAPPVTGEKCGVFVTLNKITGTETELRGCIGFPYPYKDLLTAVKESARSAAFSDPRFSPVTEAEMPSILVEVSVLTPPETVKVSDPQQYPGEIKVGQDGLIISKGLSRGLLLPQVAVDWGWDADEFLTQCCFKAGLSPDSWLLEGTEVQKFQAIIYAEESPSGKIKRHELT
ncbi:MAG: TIGR00296 family protein [Candidatus Bathyarchaeota archaeon]|nr:TIGR00296 family protein [Candidatus Bathyarchaeota archaeon]